ncbi:hypothetical protein F4824DRAFT_456803 [Ustulina deusta]|nr:hypothetical protein F4824DRAFT_456803 [Ustulina deusta]
MNITILALLLVAELLFSNARSPAIPSPVYIFNVVKGIQLQLCFVFLRKTYESPAIIFATSKIVWFFRYARRFRTNV